MAGIVLWENPNPASSFVAQTITLSSDDYDVLEFYYKTQGTSNILLSAKTLKGYDVCFCAPSGGSGVGPINIERYAKHESTVAYNVDDCQRSFADKITTNNAYAIPVKVVGYKS